MLFGFFGIGLAEMMILGLIALGLIGGVLALVIVLAWHSKNHPYEQDE